MCRSVDPSGIIFQVFVPTPKAASVFALPVPISITSRVGRVA